MNLVVNLVVNLAVTAAVHLAVVAPSRRAALVTPLPDGTTVTSGTTNVATTETTNAGIATMIVVTGTMTAETASAPVNVPALLTTGIVMLRMIGKDATTTVRDATTTESAVTTTVRISRTAKTGKVCDLFR